MSDLAGALLADRYQLLELIARGGMATVYEAKDLKLDRLVAVKVIHPHLAEDPVFRDKFFREARMLAKVNHSNLVNIYDQGDDNGRAFIVLELVKGITLRQALNDFGKLSTEQITQVSKAVLSALAQAHDSGIVHRDLKPENILLADDGRIKVTDFGLARELTADTDTGSLVGTVAYLAPEVIRRGKTETTSDIYSFGIMLYEMLTGLQPYQGEDAMQIAFKHTSEKVPSALIVNPAADAKLNDLMLSCTQSSAGNRPQNAKQVLDVLLGLAQTKPDLSETLVMPDNTNFTEVIGDLEPQELPFVKHGSKYAGLRWLVASVLALSLGSLGGWWFGSGPGALIAIPATSDKTQVQATKTLSSVTSHVLVRSIFSADFPEGIVVGTEPAAGILIPRDSQVTILISKGKETVAVPQVKGLDLVTASAEIVSARLAVGKVTEWFSADYPIGTVYSYTGMNGIKLPVSSSIDLKVSLGSIPLVQGLQLTVARAALEAAGLNIRKVNYKFSNSFAKGEVIAVSPDEQEVGKGSTVVLVVSKGPNTVTMPVVKGETILAGKALLESLGLKVVIDTRWLVKEYGIKRITGASELAGTKLVVGTSVTIRSR
jgi:serine/threonine-protein kinase